MKRGLLAIAVFAVAASLFGASLFGASAARAAEAIAVRGWDHGDFGRLVFDWTKPVGHTVTQSGRQLLLRFDETFTASYLEAAKQLRRYVSAIEAGPDGSTAVLMLKAPMSYRSFTVGSSVALDLRFDRNAVPFVSAVGTEGEIDVPSAPATEEEGKLREPANVRVRAGDHGTFSRLVVDWPAPVDYRLRREDGNVQVAFSSLARFDLRDIAHERPAHIRSVKASSAIHGGGDAAALDIEVAPGAEIKHFRLGTKTVIDVAAPRQTGATAPRGANEPVAASAAPPSALEEPSPRALTAAAVSESVPVVLTDSGPGLMRLRFDWKEPVAVAAFRRAGFLWIVFDRPARFDLSSLGAESQRFNGVIGGWTEGGAGIVRFANPRSYEPSMQRDGNAWIVELKTEPTPPLAPIDVVPRPDEDQGRVVLPVTDAQGPFMIRDPEVGDVLVIAPVPELGRGLPRDRMFAQFRLLRSAQGIALTPRAESIDVRIRAQGVEISADGALQLSSRHDADAARAAEPADEVRLMPLRAWAGDPRKAYTLKKKEIEDRLFAAAPRDKPLLRLKLAQLEFAYRMPRETLVQVARALDDDPRLLEAPDVRALRGVSALLTGDPAKAEEDLNHPSLDVEPEIVVWRAALAAAREEWEAAVVGFRESGDRLFDLPDSFAHDLALTAAEAAVESDQFETAQAYLDALDSRELSSDESGRWAYLRGAVLAATDRPEEALAIWEEAARSRDRRVRTASEFARTRLLYDLGRISAADAAEVLERLKFAWRGDRLEFRILRTLAELYLEAGRYRDTLASLRDAATFFPGRPEVPAVTQEMSEIFLALFHDGKADSLQPLDALAIYDEFRELTPADERGEAMVRRLAERLVEVDLLAEAGDLLEHQVRFRLKGAERVRVGTRLAEIRLLSRAPEAALAALDASTDQELPEALRRERLRLRSRALLDLGREDEALQALDNDSTAEGKLLRADLLMAAGKWREAGLGFADYALAHLGREAALGPEDQRLVVRWAMALALAGDDQGLAELRRRFGAAMADGPFAKDFIAVTAHDASPPATLAALSARVAEAGAMVDFFKAYQARTSKEAANGAPSPTAE